MQTEIQQPITETSLLSAIGSNNAAAFGLLYDGYSHLLFGVIYSVTCNVELSEDLLQKTFSAIWNGLKTRDVSKQRFLTWMICIARNFAKEAMSCQKLWDPSNN